MGRRFPARQQPSPGERGNGSSRCAVLSAHERSHTARYGSGIADAEPRRARPIFPFASAGRRRWRRLGAPPHPQAARQRTPRGCCPLCASVRVAPRVARSQRGLLQLRARTPEQEVRVRQGRSATGAADQPRVARGRAGREGVRCCWRRWCARRRRCGLLPAPAADADTCARTPANGGQNARKHVQARRSAAGTSCSPQ